MRVGPPFLLDKHWTTTVVANYRIIFQMLSPYKAKETLLPTLLVTNKMPEVKKTCSLVLDYYSLKITVILMCYSADFSLTQAEILSLIFDIYISQELRIFGGVYSFFKLCTFMFQDDIQIELTH